MMFNEDQANSFDTIQAMRGSVVRIMGRQYDNGFADGRAYERLAHETYRGKQPAPSEFVIGVALLSGIAFGILIAVALGPTVFGYFL